MARRAVDGDFNDQNAEDWIEYELYTTTFTAAKPTMVLNRKVDTSERYTVEEIGTNGGADFTLELRNKNDVFGEPVNGLMAPIMPRDDWYKIRVPVTFEAGDHVKLYATSNAGTTADIKFFIHGFKVDKSGA